HRNAPHSHRLDGSFIFLTVKACVRSNHSWWSPELTLVLFDGGNQQVGVLGAFGEHFVVGDDLVLGLLHFNHVAELIGLAGLALTNDFRVRLENTQDLMGILRDPLKHARLGLPHHLWRTPGHRRHVNNWLAFTPCARATSATDAPGSNVSSTIFNFSSID